MSAPGSSVGAPGQIALLFDASDPVAAEAAEIVRAALVRSFSAAPVRSQAYESGPEGASAAVAIRPRDHHAEGLAHFAREGRKLLILGSMEAAAGALAGTGPATAAPVSEEEAGARGRLGTPFDASEAVLVWHPEHAAGAEALPERAYCRFDFEEEWNHRGHGRIRAGDGPWSFARVEDEGEALRLATLRVGGRERGVAATRLERDDASILWMGRPVGPVDGLDVAVVERFFCDHRVGELPCWPAWCDWPPGHDGAATFRLDCDEAVASARPLFERYRERGVPVSLALLAGLELGEDDRRLVHDALAAGGTLLSHSLRHRPDWGRDEAEARAEARGSRERIEALFPEAAPVRFAVSPFHRNPPHALRAVAESYEALVTGLIANDPACLLGRAGVLPFCDPPLVSHSQQNMLHGDCFARCKERIDPWREGYESHRSAGALYGYLDHPFSERYAYGWAGEAQRIAAHDALLDAIARGGAAWLPSQGRALAHLVRRSHSELGVDAAGRPVARGPEGPDGFMARLGGAFRPL